MKFTIQVLIESPDALPLSVAIQTIERSCEQVEDVGLRLDEAKAIVHGLQEQLSVNNWQVTSMPTVRAPVAIDCVPSRAITRCAFDPLSVTLNYEARAGAGVLARSGRLRRPTAH